MIVLDNSVLVASLVDAGPVGVACAGRMVAERLAAPALIDVEAANALRGLLRGGRISGATAGRAVTALAGLPIQRIAHTPLLERMWELRDNLTAYDAAYVALAERLGVPLVTGDRRLSRAPGLTCVVEVIA